jgi:hypothetical protein
MVAKDPLFFFKIKRSRKQGQARYVSIYLAADISKEGSVESRWERTDERTNQSTEHIVLSGWCVFSSKVLNVFVEDTVILSAET